MDLDPRLYFWSTILKVTQLTRRMHRLFLEWMYDLVESKHVCAMAGSFGMARKSFSQWYFHQITAIIWMRWNVSKPSLLNIAFTDQICEGSARRSVSLMHAAINGYSSFNLTLQSKNLSFKRPSKLQGTCASSCQNSIVSSTPLNTSGAWWKNIFVIIATTLLMGWRKICRKHWIQFPYKPFVDGNIGYFAGWTHTGQDWDQLRLNSRLSSSVLSSTNHTDAFQRM